MRAFRTVLRWTSAAALGTVVLAATVALVCVALAAAREREDPARAAPSTGRFVRGGDVEVFVQEAGPADGPAVVLVHGTGAALIARAWSAAPHDRCYIHPPSMDEATVSTHTSNGSPPI